MDLALFAIVSLAAFRATRFVTLDSILDKPREAFKRKFPPDPEHAKLHRRVVELKPPAKPVVVWGHAEIPDRKISKWGVLISCPWCCGFWISGAVVAVVAQFAVVELPLLWWPAVSAVVGLLARNLDADA